MSKSLFNALENTKGISELKQSLKNNKIISLYDVAEGEYPFLSAILSTKNSLLIVCANDKNASNLATQIENLTQVPVYCITSRDKQFSRVAQSQDSIWDRISALGNMLKQDKAILCCSIEAACDIQMDPKTLQKSCFKISIGDIINPYKLLDRLISIGYERVDIVEGKGQCSLRGDILDIFSPSQNSAVRIEFFDNDIDTIRIFDSISQRSIRSIDSFEVFPATECLILEEDREYACKNIKKAITEPANTGLVDSKLLPTITSDALDEEFLSDSENLENSKSRMEMAIDQIKNGLPMLYYQTWLPLLNRKTHYLADYLQNPNVILIEPDILRQRQFNNSSDYNERFSHALLNGLAFNMQSEIMLSFESFISYIDDFKKIIISDLKRGLGNISPESIISLGSKGIIGYQSNIKLLAKDLEKYLNEDYKIYIFAGSHSRSQRIENTLKEYNIPYSSQEEREHSTNIISLALNSGFLIDDEKIAVISDGDIFGISYKKLKTKYKSSEKIASYTELSSGDYVVHENYGIGIYCGIENIEHNGFSQDYLLIKFAGDDKLYVPTDQFDRIQKYASSSSSAPVLNKLGGTQWQKKKSQAKKQIKDLAFDLLKLYAQREQKSGFAFSSDNPWQMQFEDDFPYELTVDQEKCLSEIYADMESHKNMDRLLCGDVGYGKTELALRAAFKAVYDNKQVAFLAPTTILAQQHYQTIAKRFRHFPIRFEMLSRFKSSKEQKEIIEKVNNGEIDIIIGTHKLLSKDIKFKNLGLLIVDEEQRFGVGHKELIKNLKKNVDVLTLSATPIPRTLYMSMIGVRDISIIETPPEDRLPVKTYIIEYNDLVIRDAINRELRRGGQIYYLYNKVETIDNMAKKLKELVPECRIGVAHGQMREKQLESTMLDFFNGSYDLLLCTTIIENGLDVPEANTLIVHEANRFGLSQLYQLRGRVGRNNRQAYAYFTIRQDMQLSEVAQKRLKSIKEFTEFGAGYRIAMRDLEIRGAGNIFGPEQSGYLNEIGYDMYVKMIERTINELQGKLESPDDIETRINLPLDSYLPKDYVQSEKERVEIYKRIAMIKDVQSRMDIEEELIDRFGDIPEEVENLTLIAHLRAYTRMLAISLVQFKAGVLYLNMDVSSLEDPSALLKALDGCDKRLYFSHLKPYGLRFNAENDDVKSCIKTIIPIIEKIVDKYNYFKKENSNEEAKPDKHSN